MCIVVIIYSPRRADTTHGLRSGWVKRKKIYGGNNNDSIDNKKQERDVNWRSEDARSEALRGS